MNINITIDTLSITLGIVLLILSVLSTVMNPFLRFRRSKPQNEEEDNAARHNPLPSLSVIITPHREGDKLEKNLPLILNQIYPGGFRLIVVAEQGDRETEDALKRIKNKYSQQQSDGELYVTFIPDSSRYVSRKRLAMTLGAKAAQSEWILFSEASSRPDTQQWLTTMAQACDNNVGLIIGYGHYSADTPSFMRFERLQTSFYLMREDKAQTAYRTVSHNVMIRKDDFLNQEGFEGSLHLPRGEYDSLVNKFSQARQTYLVTNPEAWVTDDSPSKKAWRAQQVFYIETRKILKRSFPHRLLFNADQCMLHLTYIAIVAAAVYSVLTIKWLILAADILALGIVVIGRLVTARRAIHDFNEEISLWLVLPFELRIVWHNAMTMVRHKFTDKIAFTTHKQ